MRDKREGTEDEVGKGMILAKCTMRSPCGWFVVLGSANFINMPKSHLIASYSLYRKGETLNLLSLIMWLDISTDMPKGKRIICFDLCRKY